MNYYRALMELKTILGYEKTAWTPLFDTTPEEDEAFKKNHPGAHFVIGDFEITCLNPEKYNL